MTAIGFKIGLTAAVTGGALAVFCALSGLTSPAFGLGIFLAGMFLALFNALTMLWRT